jgi:catechol 2,3-dioxygenase-like lactoylglutathione lyase family enzyme
MILGIDHIEIIVHDLDVHVSFYEKLGFVVLKRTTHHGGSVEMKLPGDHQVVLELHQVGAEEVCGVNHIAFGVHDVAETKQQLVSSGVRFEHNPPKYGGPVLATSTGRWLANFRSPDGGRLQLAGLSREISTNAPDQEPWAPPTPGTLKP